MAAGDGTPAYVVAIADAGAAEGTGDERSIAAVLCRYFPPLRVAVLPFECFRRAGTDGVWSADAYDFEALFECIACLKRGEDAVLADGTPVNVADVMIVEGLHVFHDHQVNALYDMKVFVDVDNDIRLCNLVQQACKDGADIPATLHEYRKLIKPVFDGEFKAQRGNADTVLVGGLDNMNAVKLLIDRISQVLMLSNSRSGSPSGARPF